MVDELMPEGILVIGDIESLVFVRWHVWWHHVDSGHTILYLVIQTDKGLVFSSTGFLIFSYLSFCFTLFII